MRKVLHREVLQDARLIVPTIIIGKFLAFLTENQCDNALDLDDRSLVIDINFKEGISCQWLISAQDNDDYVTLEFQKFNVRNTAAFK